MPCLPKKKRCTLNKHDRYVQRLYDRIKDDYDAVERHVVLESKKCRKAEIDLIGFREGKAYVFEVKCSYRVVKARKQLQRILRLLPTPVAAVFFYCGSADALELIDDLANQHSQQSAH